MLSGRNILIVDDDRVLAEGVAKALSNNGFQTALVASGEAGLRHLASNRVDLVILDLSLPDMDGVEVCRQIRRESDVPIIMLTARTDETDRIVGLELGADDYVCKPFSLRELVARVKAVLRRSPARPPASSRALRTGDIEVDIDGMTVTKGGQIVDVTPTEMRILRTLMESRGRLVKRQELEQAVWGEPASDPHVIEVHVSNLRRKLEDDPRRPQHLLTVRGLGYRWV
ncbi:MAG: response regulator transcription factor [Armatimonadetes bacterium]|nr:response regulator transcription factor [Armatimonadota bacterium]